MNLSLLLFNELICVGFNVFLNFIFMCTNLMVEGFFERIYVTK